MAIRDEIRKLMEAFKVANDDVIGNVARQVLNLSWKEGLSARNQAHKILDELALTGAIKKGKGFYSVKEYQGEFKEHDRLLMRIIARLILLNLPITVYREVSFPVGIRSDIVALIGNNGKAICVIVEAAITEEPAYLGQKMVAWRNWKEANRSLEKLFATPIPHFTLAVYGKSHPEATDFEKFMEEVKR